MVPHRAIYQHAALYDLAFSYRNYAVEGRFLRDAYQRRQGRAPRNFLEIAAGPACHALEMRSAGLDVLALDLSSDMAAHARQRASARDIVLPYVVANMIEFTTPGKFDLAACLLCSASYLLTDQDVLSHLASVRAALASGGIYVIELTHPSELRGAAKSNTTWTMRDDAGELDVAWSGDPSSAIEGIWRAQVRLLYRPFDGAPPLTVQDEASQRGFTYPEIVSLARRSGFSVEAALGGFDENVALDSPEATRMIVILAQA